MSEAELTTLLRASPLLPVLRTADAGEALSLAAELAVAGVRAVEFTATTRGWSTAVTEARRDLDVVVGAGTVVNPAMAEQAIAAGAQFLVSPYPVPQVAAVAEQAGVPFIQGGFTPAEVIGPQRTAVSKLFPAHVGGPGYLRSLLAVHPAAAVIPTGGIRLEQVPEWLAAGAVAVGVGSGLLADPRAAAAISALLARVGSSSA